MALFELKQDYENEKPEWKRPTFKDCAKADIGLAFFCADEFAEMHDVDGKEALVVFEEDGLKEHSAHWEYGAKQNMDTGLYNACAVLYIRVEDYGPKPKVGKILTMDKKRRYTIDACEDEAGVYRMKLTRVRQ